MEKALCCVKCVKNGILPVYKKAESVQQSCEIKCFNRDEDVLEDMCVYGGIVIRQLNSLSNARVSKSLKNQL